MLCVPGPSQRWAAVLRGSSLLAEVTSSLQPPLCPGGGNVVLSSGCLAWGGGSEAARKTNSEFFTTAHCVQHAVAERQLGGEGICTEQRDVVRQRV